MATENISVPEVHCNHCVQSIEGALQPLEGVRRATVDLADRSVEVEHDGSVDRARLVELIEAQGYEVA